MIHQRISNPLPARARRFAAFALLVGGIPLTLRAQQPTSVAPVGNFASAVQAIAVESNGTIWVGTETNGILRSADGGRSWTSAGLSDRNIRAIQVESDGRVLAVVAGWSGGLFETRNGGATWERQGPTKYAQAVVRDPVHSLYFLGTRGGSVLRSDPAGWKGVGRGLGMTNVHSLLVSNDGVLFVGTEDGIYRSRNLGETWERPASGVREGTVRAIAQLSSGTLIAGTHRGVFRSTDAGTTWTSSAGLPVPTNTRALAVDGAGRVWAATDAGLFWSNDDGSTWSRSESPGGFAAVATGPAGQVYAGPSAPGTLVVVQSQNAPAAVAAERSSPSRPGARSGRRPGRFVVYLVEPVRGAGNQITDPNHLIVAPLLMVDGGRVYPGNWPYYRGGNYVDTEDRRALAAVRDTLVRVYFPSGTLLRLVRGGVQVGTAPLEPWRTLPDELAGGEGTFAIGGRFFCWDAAAERRPGTPDASLAVAVDGVGRSGPPVDREARPAEVARLRAAVRNYLSHHGADASALTDLRLNLARATDLDHDGTLELVGYASAGGSDDQLTIVISAAGDPANPVFVYHVNERYTGAGFLDHLDLDGDGRDEILMWKSVMNHSTWSVFTREGNGWSEQDVGDAHPCFSDAMQARMRAASSQHPPARSTTGTPPARVVLYAAWRAYEGEYAIMPLADFRGDLILEPISEALAEARRTATRPETKYVELFYPDTAVFRIAPSGTEIAAGTTTVNPNLNIQDIPVVEAGLHLTSGGFNGTVYTSVPAGAITDESQPTPAEALTQLRQLSRSILTPYGVPQAVRVSVDSTVAGPGGVLAATFHADAGGRRHVVLAVFRRSAAGLQPLAQQHLSYARNPDDHEEFGELPLAFLHTPAGSALLTQVNGYEYTGYRLYMPRATRWVQVFPRPSR